MSLIHFKPSFIFTSCILGCTLDPLCLSLLTAWHFRWANLKFKFQRETSTCKKYSLNWTCSPFGPFTFWGRQVVKWTWRVLLSSETFWNIFFPHSFNWLFFLHEHFQHSDIRSIHLKTRKSKWERTKYRVYWATLFVTFWPTKEPTMVTNFIYGQSVKVSHCDPDSQTWLPLLQCFNCNSLSLSPSICKKILSNSLFSLLFNLFTCFFSSYNCKEREAMFCLALSCPLLTFSCW